VAPLSDHSCFNSGSAEDVSRLRPFAALPPVAQAINYSILTGSLRMRVPIPFPTIHRPAQPETNN